MDIICFQQIDVHHPLNLLPQPDYQLHAGGHQVHPRQGEDGSQYYQRSNMTKITPAIL